MGTLSAHACWAKLSGLRAPLMRRLENYASLTIPKICLPEGLDQMSADQTHDYQSLGAQVVNHLTNKLMLAMFAPSRPFFRLQLGDVAKKKAEGIPQEDIATLLARVEREAVQELDARAQRPKLYSLMRHLIVTGNALLVLEKKAIRVMGMKYFCVKRDGMGRLHTLLIRELLKFDELEEDVREAIGVVGSPDAEVAHYKMITREPSGSYKMTQWVNNTQLGDEFNGKWSEDALPYRVITWDLADEADYATGLVEDYAGDLEALSALSESVVDGAVLGAEFRWMVRPTSQTSADDLANSENGDALSGNPEDINSVQGGNPQAIAVLENVLQRYERRISLGFLLQTGATRNAERVTAEELRITAAELDTAYGGVYSSLSHSIQAPLARWLLAGLKGITGELDLKIAVITGLDALSRNGDLENLRLAFSDFANLINAPEQLVQRIKFSPLAKFVGDGRGIDLMPFIKGDEEMAQEQAAMQQARVNEAAATSAAEQPVQE